MSYRNNDNSDTEPQQFQSNPKIASELVRQGEKYDQNLPDETNNGYTDFSKVKIVANQGVPTSKPIASKRESFPLILHDILSNPKYTHIITWLPSGRSWCILNPKLFEKEVIPRHFRHGKYASFMRQVNGWGFSRESEGPGSSSYSHKVRIIYVLM